MATVIYTKPNCPYCSRAINILKLKQIAFKEVDVSETAMLFEEMILRSGGRKTVPQIFIHNVYIGGCDDLESLYLSGELDKLLKK
jgi:glutaredoxin 3